MDSHRHQPSQFILTGSQNLLLTQQVTESLAGRAAVLKLLPMSQREIARCPDRPLVWEAGRLRGDVEALPYPDLWQHILRGCYPELVANPQRDSRMW